jgi:hypothetical protein
VDIRVECVTPDGLSGKKRVWFRGIFHLIGILGESPFVSKLRKAESAQHSVHPIPDRARRGHNGRARRTPFGQSGSLRGLELVPSKWRSLVPPTSPHQGANATSNASRWAAQSCQWHGASSDLKDKI